MLKITANWIYRLLRYILGGVFIYAGMSKLVAPADFAVVISGYGLLPEPLIGPVAILLPIFEVFCGLALFADIRGSLSAIMAQLVLFMGVLGWGIYLGLDIDCGCYGPSDPQGEAYHSLRTSLVRDMVLFGGGCLLYFLRTCYPQHMRPVAPETFFSRISGGSR